MYPEWVSEFKAENTSVFNVLNSWQYFITSMEIRNLREVDKHVNNETILNQEHLNVTLLKYINKIIVPLVCLLTEILRWKSKSW